MSQRWREYGLDRIAKSLAPDEWSRTGPRSPYRRLIVRDQSPLCLKEIRIEHTLFALPFAYAGAILAARGMPSWRALLWITLAVLGARTAAMAANRYFDRDIDARNPRTARRALAQRRARARPPCCGRSSPDSRFCSSPRGCSIRSA